MGMGQVVDYSQFILQIEKAIANGVATLDSSAKVPKNQIDLIASDVGAIAIETDPTVSGFTKDLDSSEKILNALNAASGTISNSVLPNEVAALQSLADTTGFIRKTGDGTYSIDVSSYLNLTGGTVTGQTTFSNLTESTSTTTGGVVFGGGVGIAGALNTGGRINGISIGIGINNSALKVGVNAGYSNTTGSSWSAFGLSAGYSNTTGDSWSAFGRSAGYSNTTGGYWSAFGRNAGYSNTTGGYWSAFGRNAGYSNTTGNYWSAFGVNAGYSNTTGNYWSAFGMNAGYYASDGVTGLTISNNSCFIGANTKGTDGASNENVFGYNAIGNGSNTVTIGDSNITNNFFRGAISLNGNQVLTSRRTGWGAPTGIATRTTFETSTVTLPQLAERVKALIDNLITHGLIGA